MKFKKQMALLMASVMVIAAFSMPVFAEESDSFAEAVDFVGENNSDIEEGDFLMEENCCGDESDFLNEDGVSADGYQSVMPLSSCPHGYTHPNGFSKSHVVSGSGNYGASWGFTHLADITDGSSLLTGQIAGEFERRPILGDRVRTRVYGVPRTRCGVAGIISGSSSHTTEHARHGGNYETNWVSLTNHHAYFSGIAWW